MSGLALLGHETLLVYVLHLYLLFGGVFGDSPLARWHGQMSPLGAFGGCSCSSRCCSPPRGCGAPPSTGHPTKHGSASCS